MVHSCYLALTGVIAAGRANAVKLQANSDQVPIDASKIYHNVTKDGMLYEHFYIDEGDVSLSYPSNITPESFENLKDYLNLFLRKIHRRMGLPPVANTTPSD